MDRNKVKSALFFIGGVLMALGGLSCALGIAYYPEIIGNLDPILEVTKDAWLLFFEAHGYTMVVYGIVVMLVGALLVWFGELIPKKNRIVPGWEKRVC